MEGETVDVGEMAVEDSQRLRLIGRPEPRCPVVAGGGEVVAEGGEGAVPDGEHVALVAHQTCPSVQRPEANDAILPAGEQQGLVRVEGEPVDRTTVANQAF